ncbi:MAG: NAD(P)/FAD-dependent oxidoreductase [Candidatus Pelagadaptatus aseana]|uniref:flavin-containing monooxygenase n=1 Tax=Candidatus Pelagadaptatus aseana TaxID=3120508 RepID=UPI0039B19528
MSYKYEVIIIGSGFGGQLAAINLQRRGISNFLILERRDFMGGTWAQNTYPGAAVDVQSPLYSLSFEPYDWSQLFAEQQELSEYTHHIIDKYRLRESTRLNTNVEKIEWCDEAKHWTVEASDGVHFYARFVVNASGPLSTPVIPEFPGRESFQGESFHTNNWNHDFDYRGKKVAVIGSGASAAQVIPAIANDVQELHVFQRTPHWVMPRPDYQFKPWQRRLLKNRWLYATLRVLIYWALEFRVLGFKYSKKLLDTIGTKQALAHIHRQIKDPALRKKVTPEFTIGCKRVIVSNTLYPAYCRDNVTLHDRHDGIKTITPEGLVTDSGKTIALDLIVYSTGYDATDGVISYPVIGRHNKSLADFWSDYPRAYLGTAIPDFPNLFIVTGPNTGIGHTSALFLIESQMRYILNSIERVRRDQWAAVEVNADAEQRYTDWIHEEMQQTVWHHGGCNSWYKSKSGKVIAMFPGFSFTFRRWASQFKENDHSFYGKADEEF